MLRRTGWCGLSAAGDEVDGEHLAEFGLGATVAGAGLLEEHCCVPAVEVETSEAVLEHGAAVCAPLD
jgi:hypothetical protein